MDSTQITRYRRQIDTDFNIRDFNPCYLCAMYDRNPFIRKPAIPVWVVCK